MLVLTLQGATAAWQSCSDTADCPFACSLEGDTIYSSWKQPEHPYCKLFLGLLPSSPGRAFYGPHAQGRSQCSTANRVMFPPRA